MRRPHFVTIRHFICPPATTTFGSCRLQLYYYYFYIAIARAFKKKTSCAKHKNDLSMEANRFGNTQKKNVAAALISDVVVVAGKDFSYVAHTHELDTGGGSQLK